MDEPGGPSAPAVPLRQHIAWLMAEAQDDHVSLSHISYAANAASDADPALGRMERCLGLVARLLGLGFRAVDLTGGGGSVPWPDQSPDAVLRRIRQAWLESGDEGLVAFRFWFGRAEDAADT